MICTWLWINLRAQRLWCREEKFPDLLVDSFFMFFFSFFVCFLLDCENVFICFFLTWLWIKLRAQCPRCREENFLPCGHEAPRDWSVEIWFFWASSSSNSVTGMIPSHNIHQLQHKAPKIHYVLYFWRSTLSGSPSITVWRIFPLSSLNCDATRYKIIF